MGCNVSQHSADFLYDEQPTRPVSSAGSRNSGHAKATDRRDGWAKTVHYAPSVTSGPCTLAVYGRSRSDSALLDHFERYRPALCEQSGEAPMSRQSYAIWSLIRDIENSRRREKRRRLAAEAELRTWQQTAGQCLQMASQERKRMLVPKPSLTSVGSSSSSS